ncbi:lysylphosphatidylglycerol synthase transmembrane domain-containing protein [Amycolatopsis magusensis]|uniref:lysylphosphatidylglycerol synthase transmembrane domain-containing protein n=1 Tax=Amycolatopsis magusensis TaxID=882444 RepID=UPI0024A7F396|nr:lysylphosphatidylglycerol synthase transmembrane domain-containing protein [Amycolatopsis magusensis]MDI5978278.1 lysylphosphatidylglycerol synthase transmembrane domain-containing protein [Amycolatopsis magusensis]
MTAAAHTSASPEAGKRVLWTWARLLAGAALLGFLCWQLGTGALLDGLRAVTVPAVAAALVIGLLTTVFSAARWVLIARSLGLRLPLGAAVASYYRALFLNVVLPGGVLGDVHRAVRHGKDEGDVGRGVRAVVLERTGGQVVLIAAGVAVLTAQPTLVPTQAREVITMIGIALVPVVLCLLAVAPVVARRWADSGSKWRRGTAATVADLRTGLLSRRTWPGVLGFSAAALAGHLTLFLVAARVAGTDAPITQLLPIFLLALLAMGLPVNVGGWGPREGVTALTFGVAGLGAAQGLTVAVVYGLLSAVASLPGAGVLAFGSRRSAAADPASLQRVEAVPERLDEPVEHVPAFSGGRQ